LADSQRFRAERLVDDVGRTWFLSHPARVVAVRQHSARKALDLSLAAPPSDLLLESSNFRLTLCRDKQALAGQDENRIDEAACLDLREISMVDPRSSGERPLRQVRVDTQPANLFADAPP
jgi:hypothetical protein